MDSIGNVIDSMLRGIKRRQVGAGIFCVLALLVAGLVSYGLSQTGEALTHKVRVLDCKLAGAEYMIVHTHNDDCYDKNGTLVCPLKELAFHTHDESCYEVERVLVCGLEEGEGHTHDESCFPAASTEGEGDDFFIWEYAPACGLEETEGHTHTDACWEERAVLVCGKEEITPEMLHAHGESCYDKDGRLTCDRPVIVAHRHTDACFFTEEGNDSIAWEADMPAQSFRKKIEGILVEVEAPAGAFPIGTEMRLTMVEVEEYLDTVSDVVDGEIIRARAVDICFFDQNGAEIEPLLPIRVEMKTARAADADETHVVHVGDSGESELMEATETAGNSLVFESNAFSVYVLVETKNLEKKVITTAGELYNIKLSYDESALIPEGASLKVEELSGEDYSEYICRTAVAMAAADFGYARVFDISIVDEKGAHLEPAAKVTVSVELLDSSEDAGDFSVVHFDEAREQPEQMRTKTEGQTVSFKTDSFSAYAIVKGPSAVPACWTQLGTLDMLRESASEGLYIGTTSGYYLKNESDIGSQDANTTGILKTTPAKSFPADEAVLYFFEAVEGTENQFYIYCLAEDGSRRYVNNEGDKNLRFTDSDGKTAFSVEVDNQKRFRFHNGSLYWNMWNGAGGNHIAAYNVAGDGNNYFYVWEYRETDSDPYQLDGKTYGLMYWDSNTAGKAMMAEGDGTNLNALALTVMTKKNKNTDKLFVPNDSDISLWTFEWAGEDNYYLSSAVDGSKKFLKIQSGKLSLSDAKDESCTIQVLPGSGTHEGELCLKSGNSTITYSGDVDTGFNTRGKAGTEWLKLVDLSELTSEYFMTYSASKVSVSDPEVTNGTRIIVYSRVWNDTLKKYEFYAVGHDGSLIRCYESGDSIQWVGSRLNTLLWSFVEYYWEGTTDPNYYYELYNQYSEKYIAPQVTGGQILSPGTLGLSLNGRRNGQYYSDILAWDDDNYAYVGLKADAETGKIVACPKAEADDFYFAVMQDIPVDDELTTVPTVDHTRYGITMKMVNFPLVGSGNNQDVRLGMSNFLGSDNGYKNGNTEPGLLGTQLGSDGYPVSKADNSLGDWFTDAPEVNHLFIASTFEGTGYYEFDSVQNFAHLDPETNCFEVYKELGTTNDGGVFHTHGHFFPYNDIAAGVFSTKKNTTSALGGNLPDSDPRKYEKLYQIQKSNTNYSPDYYLGMEVTASFTQTPNGLDDWGHDIIYEFTGDDDFWLYVDGELIIDLGGIHDALAGSVNYRTGDVYVNGSHTTLRELFENNFRARNPEAGDEEAADYLARFFDEGSTIFRDYTNHTMKIYYLERGAGASNLHMRFNLASIRPGTVQLSKTLSGVDATESVLAEFPYQIYYKTSEYSPERLLTNMLPHDAVQTENYVFYKGTTTPVQYRKSVTVGGVSYQDVFMLKPGETAEISFPTGISSYRVVECGVNTDIYSSVFVNGTQIEGTAGERYPENRQDFGIAYATTEERAKVAYENAVNPDALRNLCITKKLYMEDGVTAISAEQDATTFSYRLYLGTEFDEDLDNAAANMHTYHVKDPNGTYCKWDSAQKKLVPIGEGKTDFTALTVEEKEAATFHTSSNGAISRISAGYTVEVRNVLAGTRFKLVERPSEIPDGYSFQKYEYNGENYSGTLTDAVTGVADTVTASQDPHVNVCNLRGWGLRVNKLWSDQDFMQTRDETYFAVFTGTSEETLTIVSEPNTLRRLPFGEKSLYWYFLHLPVNVPFEQYQIREVKLTGATMDQDGYVTSYDSIKVLPEGSKLELQGTQKGESDSAEFSYTVLYKKGEGDSDSNVRVDTVTNNRPGIILKKADQNGDTLADAVFTIVKGETQIGTFTSAEDGMITLAFLSDDQDYMLTEIKAPHGYHGLETPMSIRLSNGEVTVGGVEERDYTLEQGEGKTPTLTIFNRPFCFEAIKKDGDTDAPLAGVHFALHKQYTVDGVTSVETSPMEGYEDLVTDSEGRIPKLDAGLAPGTYELREKKALIGYQTLTSHIRFTIGEIGTISLGLHPEGTSIKAVLNEDGVITYTLTILNRKPEKVSIWKTGTTPRAITTGAEFALYRLEDYDDTAGKPREDVQPILTGRTDEKGILSLGELNVGQYRLVETKAPAGYRTEDAAIQITVSPNGVTAMQAGSPAEVERKGGEHWVSGQDDSTWQIRVWNGSGYELPKTGGRGTALNLFGGGALCLYALALFLLRKRRGAQA